MRNECTQSNPAAASREHPHIGLTSTAFYYTVPSKPMKGDTFFLLPWSSAVSITDNGVATSNSLWSTAAAAPDKSWTDRFTGEMRDSEGKRDQTKAISLLPFVFSLRPGLDG